jgi:hypothetical protein
MTVNRLWRYFYAIPFDLNQTHLAKDALQLRDFIRAVAEQIQIARRPVGRAAPDLKKHRAFEHEAVMVGRPAQPVEPAFQTVARQHVLKLVPARLRQVEQAIAHRGRQIAWSTFGKPARSAFFWLGLRINNLHDLTTLPLSFRDARLTPASRARPPKAGLSQDGMDRVGAHIRQPVRRFAQCASQEHQGPGGCPILLRVRRAPHLLEYALALFGTIGWASTTASAWLDGWQPLTIKASHELRDRIT